MVKFSDDSPEYRVVIGFMKSILSVAPSNATAALGSEHVEATIPPEVANGLHEVELEVDPWVRPSPGDTPKGPMSVLAGTAQDSGYASMTLGSTTDDALYTDKTDDAASVFSTTESVIAAQSLTSDTKVALVDSFAALLTRELITHLEGCNDEIGPLFEVLPALLRNFSAELRAENSYNDALLQRSTAAFVRLNRS